MFLIEIYTPGDTKGFYCRLEFPGVYIFSKHVKNTPLEGRFDTMGWDGMGYTLGMEGAKVFKAINYSVMSPWEYR